MRELIAKLTQTLKSRGPFARAGRVLDAAALIGEPVHIREERQLFGWPRITRETPGVIEGADPSNGELFVAFSTDIPGERLYLHAFADELVFKEAAHV
ncbi:hypothetical protein ABID81_002546 [Frigoribacterium sp. PvP054]|uniref:hypothetical protein n=1 Tax=Frigoribacterium sp. PvP054 TaxID=3156438 RepID=UPI003398C0BB